MPTCQPPVVALLGSGSCLRLVPAAQECLGAYLPGNPMYAPPIPGHGASPNLFQELWRWLVGYRKLRLDWWLQYLRYPLPIPLLGL